MSDLQGYIPGLGRGVTISGADIATNTVTSSNVDQKLSQYISTPITSAQILALSTTPVQVIPSPGANNAVIVTDFIIDVGTGTAYAAGGTVGLYYGNGTTALMYGNSNAVFTSTTGSTVYFSGPTTGLSIVTGTAVFLGQQSGTAFTTGNETATVQAWYVTVPTGH